MDLVTKGKWKNTDIEVEIYLDPDAKFAPDLDCNSRFRLVFFQKGTGILQLNGNRRAFIAPAVFFINEQDHLVLVQSANLSAQILYFHPCYVNFIFNYHNIRGKPENFSPTDWYDHAWLVPFLDLDTVSGRQINIGPSSFCRISQLYNSIFEQLTVQPEFWVCRTRSYMLELLIYLRCLESIPKTPEIIGLPEDSDEINSLLLYLQNNYQNKITLPELAQVFKTNRTTLSQRFLVATGMSIITYLVRLRIQLAANLLRDTNLPVTEIMNRISLKNMTHFIATFLKHTGYNPKEYRDKFTCIK